MAIDMKTKWQPWSDDNPYEHQNDSSCDKPDDNPNDKSP
jgi:hypothetical protein